MSRQPDSFNPHTPAYPPNADTVPMVPPDAARDAPGQSSENVEHYVSPPGYQGESNIQTYKNKNAYRTQMRAWVVSIIYFVLGVVDVILGLRFIFRLLGANRDNAFITALYDLSHIFAGPFNNIFNDQAIGSRSVFELSTLISILIYSLIAWGLASLVRVMLSPAS